MFLYFLWLVLDFSLPFCDSANILAVLPCPSYSHQIAYTHLWKELSLRGHNVTLITTDPLNDPTLTNLTEIDVKWTYKLVKDISRMAEDDMLSMWSFHAGVLEIMKVASEAQLSSTQVQKIIKDPGSFDVVFVEFLVPEWLAFAEIYNCPKDVEKFLDDATEGCIYVSLGSNVKSSQLSPHLQKVIIEALAEIPYKVLWKFEMENSKMPKNIKTAKWFPQQKVLNHPNLKLFLCQGGLQSMEEAIYGEVPFVVIPFFSDQHQNARILKNKGVAMILDKKTVNKEELKSAIMTVMTESRFREEVKKLKQLILDEPMTGLEKAIWWTEYVIRHKGAKHLRNPAADLPSYQYYLIDVVGFLLLVILLIITVVTILIKIIWRLLYSNYKTKQE